MLGLYIESLIRSAEGMEKLFQEQLSRLKTDHIDYYLMHMLTDVDAWNRMQELGIARWQELKNAGKELEGPLYRLIAKIVKTFRIFG